MPDGRKAQADAAPCVQVAFTSEVAKKSCLVALMGPPSLRPSHKPDLSDLIGKKVPKPGRLLRYSV